MACHLALTKGIQIYFITDCQYFSAADCISLFKNEQKVGSVFTTVWTCIHLASFAKDRHSINVPRSTWLQTVPLSSSFFERVCSYQYLESLDFALLCKLSMWNVPVLKMADEIQVDAQFCWSLGISNTLSNINVGLLNFWGPSGSHFQSFTLYTAHVYIQ